MDKHAIFKIYVLPYLLEKAQEADAKDDILSISLFGSANYRPDAVRPEQLPEKDFDIWIVMKSGTLKSAQKFATKLFGTNFVFDAPEMSACILYDKFYRKFPIGQLMISPMIAMEESYHLTDEILPTENVNVVIPWFRPRARERVPEVVAYSPLLQWIYFDMQQTHIEEFNLWRLMMPILIANDGSKFLGVFVECALTGKLFYGDEKRYATINGRLLRGILRHFFLEENVPMEEFSRMLTTSQKAGVEFEKKITQRLTDWVNEV